MYFLTSESAITLYILSRNWNSAPQIYVRERAPSSRVIPRENNKTVYFVTVHFPRRGERRTERRFKGDDVELSERKTLDV